MTTILDEITESKRAHVAEARRHRSFERVLEDARRASPPRDFHAALAAPGPIKLIAEIKKASPSAQLIRASFDPVAIALAYQTHGATCLSVLTDTPYVQGSLDHLIAVQANVEIPILRKDFTIDVYQIAEARAAGADAILLIAEILDNHELRSFQEFARELGMAALVEFHDEINLPRVIASGASLIGVNNRDLKTFKTNLDHTLRLRDQIPPEIVLISESGVRDRHDVVMLEAAGVAAILVGESLMRTPDIGSAVDALLGHSPG